MRALIPFLFCACADKAAPSAAQVGAPVWHGQAEPVFRDRCMSCHQDGGSGGFSLQSAAEAAAWSSAVRAAVEAGTMPPWPPSPDCNRFEGSRGLSDEQRQLILDWVDGGALAGGDPDARSAPPEVASLERVDVRLGLDEPYTPDPPRGGQDEQRCFVLEWPGGSGYVTGFTAEPDETSIVHHVVAYVSELEDISWFYEQQRSDMRPGYNCPSGARGVNNTRAARWIGGWVPGATNGMLPEGLGIPVDEGTVIIMAVHYSLQGQEALPDTTHVAFQFEETVEKPASALTLADPAWAGGDTLLSIPAGDPSYTVQDLRSPQGRKELWAAGLHMHKIGASARIWLERASGSEECLLDIPQWAYGWQGNYPLEEPILVEEDDQLGIECVWDNSEGEEDVRWGLSPDDEMCGGFLLATEAD